MAEPPGLGHHGDAIPLRPTSGSGHLPAGTGAPTGVSGASDVEPVHLLVQGMRQLQQGYIGKGA